MERAVACAMDSPFGGIGWTRMGESDEPVEVDTVTFGAFRPEAFSEAGLFDENMVRNQDDEFNLRLREAGGRIVLDPSLTVYYRPRGSLAGVWRQYHDYGFWKVAVMLKHRQVLTVRSLVPIAFVMSVAALAGAGVASGLARRLLVGELALYVCAAIFFASRSASKNDEPVSQVPSVAATYPAFHVSYGVGMAKGWLVATWRLIAPQQR